MWSWNVLALLQRKKGNNTKAASLIKRAITIDPLNPVSRTEQWFQQSITSQQLTRYLGTDGDNYLTVAFFYNTAGLHADALQALKLALRGSPLLYYYTAYTLHPIKEKEALSNTYKKQDNKAWIIVFHMAMLHSTYYATQLTPTLPMRTPGIC